MDCDRSLISQCDQMRYVADSLKPIGSRFDNEISYEINGCILTWIANDSGLEHRFDCSNIIEIIDGYYKAEFYLDTKRIFEVPELIENYTNITDIKLTGYTQEQDNNTNHLSKNVTQKPDSTTKIDTISNASTEADSLNENNNTNNNNNNTNNELTHNVDSETFKKKGNNLEYTVNNNTNTNNNNNQSGTQLINHTTNSIIQNTQQSTVSNDKQLSKPQTNIIKKMETRNSAKISLTLRSSKTNKNIENTDIYNKDTAKTLNCYSRIPQNDIDSIRHSEAKKRKITKTVNIPVPSLT